MQKVSESESKFTCFCLVFMLYDVIKISMVPVTNYIVIDFSECARLAMEDMGQYLENKEGEVAVSSLTILLAKVTEFAFENFFSALFWLLK